jgi:hypothetical protein
MTAVPPPIYINWVKRSLNRYLGAALKTNGADDPLYREYVKAFQGEESIPAHGKVNRLTADRLIFANYDTSEYVNWIRKVLRLTTPGAAVGSGTVMDAETRRGVKKFQEKHKGSIFKNLAVDGWVGVRTEMVMMEVSGTKPPGEWVAPKPLPPKKPGSTPKPIKAKDRLKETAKIVTDPTVSCMIQKMLHGRMSAAWYWTASGLNTYAGAPLAKADRYEHVQDLNKELDRYLEIARKRRGEPTTQEIRSWLDNRRIDIAQGIRALKYLDGHLSQSKSIRRYIHEESKRPSSIYSCPDFKKIVDEVMTKVGPPYYSGNVDA